LNWLELPCATLSSHSFRYSVAVITDDAELFPEVRKHLGGEFRTSLAANEDDIKSLLERPELHACLFDLDCIGKGPNDSLDVLEEIRKIRDDVVLATFTFNGQPSALAPSSVLCSA
jgi:hypothetical protein